MKTRINFLDNMRTFLIFLVIVLHAGMTYESGFDSFWIVSDPAKYEPLAWVRTYIDLFVMFIMFFVSGYFIPNSLKNKSTKQFIGSKFKRIMVPWLIAVVTLIPAYKVIFLYSRGLPQEEWFSYFHLFQRGGTDLSFYPNNPTQSWLWFLPVLFGFQILYMALAKANLLRFNFSIKSAVILTFVIGLAYSMVISIAGLKGWAHTPVLDFQRERLLVYFMVFLLGSLCNKLNVFEFKPKNIGTLAISVLVLIPSLIVFKTIALNLFYNLIDPTRNHFIISETGDRIMYYSTALLAMFGFLYVLIFVFKTFFNKSSKLMQQLNQSSYSVYIIHMVVIGLIAVPLVSVSLPAVVKYIILIVLTFIVSNAISIGYRKIVQQNLWLKTIVIVLPTAVLFAFILLGNPMKTAQGEEQNITTSEVINTPQMNLHEAALLGNMEVIRQYINSGSDLNEKDPASGGNPLHTAASFGQTEVAQTLINAGIDVNYINNEGSTPLHTAAFFGRIEIVKVLVENGADKTIKNGAGSTALESVIVPFEMVQGIYDYLGKAYEPLGLKLDYEQIKTARPIIAEMLK